MFQSRLANFQGFIQNFSWPTAANFQTFFSTPGFYFYIIGTLFLLYWVLSILRTIKDISSRTSNIFGQILAVLLVGLGTPLVGLPIYLFLRPASYKWDRIGRREALIVQVVNCPACDKKNPLHHDFCVHCAQQLTVKCRECKSSYSRSYDYCPQCAAPNVD